MKPVIPVLFTILAVLFSGNLLTANPDESATASQRLQQYEKHLQMMENSLFKPLKWREIGPYFMSGRITDVEAYENNPYKFLLATASGGLWLTENNGTTWTPIFDHESSSTIGDIAVSQQNEQLIWVGTGEQNSSRSSYAGTGVFKSTDGGKSWKNMGLTDSHHISRILIHPKDENIVYVAVIGHLYTDNSERGLYKTTDGGNTWKHILKINDKTGIIDLAMHPTNPDILYASSWQRERKAWNFVEGGEGSTIYKTTDGGNTWNKSVKGFPQGKFNGRIGLAISPSKPNVVYAFLDNQALRPAKNDDNNGKKKNKSADANEKMFNTSIIGAELYRSDDNGENWKRTHTDFIDNLVFTYGYYFGQVRVAPDDENTVYLAAFSLVKSTDGGKTFKDISRQGGIYGIGGVHADMHALWIDPKQPKRLLLGNDGGLNISYDEGESWQKINNIPLAQCYTIHFDYQEPYNVYTGLQDNGVNVGPSDYRKGRRKNGWEMLLGGDGAFVQAQPDDPNTVYAEFQFGFIFRLDRAKQQMKSIRPKSSDKNNPYRFNWLSPFLVSPHNPMTIYMGANKVLQSVNRGNDWIEISPDLTRRKNTDGDVPFATIVALDESPFTPGLLYAGTDDGRVWVKRDIQSPWQAIETGLPQKWVTRIVASGHKKERVYLTMTGYREDDFKTYVYASEDYGKTWISLKTNLPDEPVNVIREDPVNKDVLYLGTDLTAYVSLDRGKNWYSLKNNLPTNAVYDMRVHPRENELIIGTHGRGVFILPVKDLQRMSAALLKKPLHLFKLPDIKLDTGRFRKKATLDITFYSDSQSDYTWSVQNSLGETMHFEKGKAHKGLNKMTWTIKLPGKKKTVQDPKKKSINQPGQFRKGQCTLIIRKGKSKAERKFRII